MKYALLLCGSILTASVSGCGGPAGGTDAGTSPSDAGTGVADTGLDAATTPDAPSTDDAAAEDAGASDDAALADGGADDDAAASTDAAARADTDAARCDYVAVDEVVVLCGTTYTFVSHFTSTVPRCPEFYGFTPDGPQFASTADAIASDTTCDPNCEWRFSTSVSRIYCGRRTGYESLTAADRGCGDIFRFSEGYYPSVEAHDAANPCAP